LREAYLPSPPLRRHGGIHKLIRHTRLLVPISTVILSSLIKGKTGDSNSLFPPAKDFVVETVATDLSNPMEMTMAGDLVFITELHENIKVLDLTRGVTRVVAHLEVDYLKKGLKWSWNVKSGVLGIAFAPDFEKTKWVYICYTRPGGDLVNHDHVVSRFRFLVTLVARTIRLESWFTFHTGYPR